MLTSRPPSLFISQEVDRIPLSSGHGRSPPNCGYNTDNEDKLQRTKVFFKRLIARGYKGNEIRPLFHKAITRAKAYNGPTQDEDDDHNSVILHLPFHPNAPASFYTQWIWINYWLENKNYMALVSRTTWEIDILLFSAFWYHHFFDFLIFLEFRFSISGFSNPSLVCPLMKPPRNRTITLQPIRKANSHVASKDNKVQICPSTDPFS